MADQEAGQGSPEPVAQPVFQRKNRGNIRKRPAEEQATDDGATDLKVPKTATTAPAVAFSTKRVPDERVQPFQFQSNRTIQQSGDQGLTKTLETETAFDRDARARREAVLVQQGGKEQPSNTYKGMNAYTDYTKGFRREHTIASEKGTGMHGPLRANVHIRSSVRFDYQPDVCKDYKETGFCGYGDACKFVHDRSDYKSGWELERDWETREKRMQEAGAKWGEDGDKAAGSDEDDDELPFACYICRRPWAEVDDPVVTRCKHYFCEHCALKHNARNKKCAVCEQPTNGIFNVAKDILKRTQAKQADKQ